MDSLGTWYCPFTWSTGALTPCRLVRRFAPRATVFFNSRPIVGIRDDFPFITHVEIESLPTGGWGYAYFPKGMRYARPLGKPCMGMTARFHKGWADFGGLKPYPALLYEVCQMLAHGTQCSIGDQMHPRGRLDAAAYDLIGKAYAHAEARGGIDLIEDILPVQTIPLSVRSNRCRSVLPTAMPS